MNVQSVVDGNLRHLRSCDVTVMNNGCSLSFIYVSVLFVWDLMDRFGKSRALQKSKKTFKLYLSIRGSSLSLSEVSHVYTAFMDMQRTMLAICGSYVKLARYIGCMYACSSVQEMETEPCDLLSNIRPQPLCNRKWHHCFYCFHNGVLRECYETSIAMVLVMNLKEYEFCCTLSKRQPVCKC